MLGDALGAPHRAALEARQPADRSVHESISVTHLMVFRVCPAVADP